jgi:hypothetical protein
MVEPPSPAVFPTRPRRLSWLQWHGHQKDCSRDLAKPLLDAGLPSPQEHAELSSYSSGSSTPRAEPRSRVSSRPSTPRRLSTASLSHLFSFQPSAHPPVLHPIHQVDQSSSAYNGGSPHPSTSALPAVAAAKSETSARTTGSFGKMAFNSMISSLSLSRTNTTNCNDDKDKEKEARGRSSSKGKPRSSSFVIPSTSKDKDKDRDTASFTSKESLRARSQSPFSLRRFRSRDRDQSPAPLPLEESDSESITSRRSPAVRPRTAFTDDPDSGSEYAGEETEEEDDDWSDDTAGMFDFVTERNTEQNAQIAVVGSDGLLIGEIDVDGEGDAAMDPDPLGEGVNVVVPPEPYFPSTLNRSSFTSTRGKRGGVKRKKSKHHEAIPLSTSRPLFQRDRCTITLVQGDPDSSGRRKRTYIVASDLSEESRYAVEWGIGTVLRDGDEM